jgi:hypothetical protein
MFIHRYYPFNLDLISIIISGREYKSGSTSCDVPHDLTFLRSSGIYYKMHRVDLLSDSDLKVQLVQSKE